MFLDDIIGFFSPRAGFERKLARAALRSYESGKRGRKDAGWRTSGNSANADISASLIVLREKSRSLAQNNAYAVSMVDKFVAHAIGTGITVTFTDESVNGHWKNWVEQADADGDLDFYGLQALACRTIEESGEVLVRFRNRRPEDGMDVPLQLQVMEPDYIDHLKTMDLPNGGYIINGVEFSPIGKVVQYWLFDRHPGEIGLLYKSMISKPVPADELLLVFRKIRPGQVRGVPRYAPVLNKLRDMDDIDDADLTRKKIQACFSVFVTSDVQGRTLGEETDAGARGERQSRLAPGLIQRLKPGETASFAAPPQSGDDGFSTRTLRSIAAGSGSTYEQISGDLSQVNYSSFRAGHLDFRALTEQYRSLTFIPMLMKPIVHRWLLTARLAGKIKSVDQEFTLTTPRWEYMDPVKDAKGDMILAAAGVKSLPDLWIERGLDPDEQKKKLIEIRDWLVANRLTVTFDSSVVGDTQAQDSANNSPANRGA